MNKLTDEELMDWNRKGKIPGPGETEEDFLRRILRSKPERTKHSLSGEILREPLKKVEELFDIRPDWVNIDASGKGLRFSEAAYCLVKGKDVTVTVRRNFMKKKKYLGLYRRDEVIAHELAHAGRMAFEDSPLEELLAYKTSSGRHRFWGPFFSGTGLFPWIGLSLLNGISFFPEYRKGAILPQYLVIGYFLFLIGRFLRLHRLFHAVVKKFREMGLSEKGAFCVIYRLTYREMLLIGRFSPDQILSYVQEKREKELRWRLLHAAYFSTIEPKASHIWPEGSSSIRPS